jgi:putative transposase
VTARASGGARLYREAADRQHFIQLLREVVRDYDWRCQAYCLMGTHFHLIIRPMEPTLSTGMARLLGEYAKWFNWKYERNGHLFGSRFSSQHITSEGHLWEAHQYVALNPVQAEQCDDPADRRWGSYRALAGLDVAPDFLDVEAVYDLFGLRGDAGANAYRAFVLGAFERLGSDPLRGSDPVESWTKPRKVSATRLTASS